MIHQCQCSGDSAPESIGWIAADIESTICWACDPSTDSSPSELPPVFFMDMLNSTESSINVHISSGFKWLVTVPSPWPSDLNQEYFSVWSLVVVEEVARTEFKLSVLVQKHKIFPESKWPPFGWSLRNVLARKLVDVREYIQLTWHSQHFDHTLPQLAKRIFGLAYPSPFSLLLSCFLHSKDKVNKVREDHVILKLVLQNTVHGIPLGCQCSCHCAMNALYHMMHLQSNITSWIDCDRAQCSQVNVHEPLAMCNSNHQLQHVVNTL